MNQHHVHNLVLAAVTLILCSYHIHVSAQAGQDLCRRRCSDTTAFYAKFINSYIYLQNFLTNCYNRCPPVVYQPPVYIAPTTTATTTTTSTIAYPLYGDCGLQSFTRNRVVGGVYADECEFPWMAAVSINNMFCGGTIISKRHILTAAHCMKDRYTGVIASAYQVSVRVGSSQLSRLRDYQVQQVSVDPRHVRVVNDFDVAILTLSRDLIFSECVSPICMPQVWEDAKRADYCVAAGWGIENTMSQRLVYNLKKVTLPIVDNTLCSQSYGTSYINDLKICAGDFYRGGIDTCQGDSGGPLVCKFGPRFVVMGIVSFGSGCARPMYPGIYTRVSHPSILTFINDNTMRK